MRRNLCKHMNRASIKLINQLTESSLLWLTGPVSCEEAVPPLAGAALHPSPDDPGHVHPHVTFTGQLSQHQAVHVAMRAEAGSVCPSYVLWEKPRAVVVVIFLPHHWSTLKHSLSRGTAREQQRDCISLPNLRRDIIQTFRRKWMGDGDKGHCRLCETRG